MESDQFQVFRLKLEASESFISRPQLLTDFYCEISIRTSSHDGIHQSHNRKSEPPALPAG